MVFLLGMKKGRDVGMLAQLILAGILQLPKELEKSHEGGGGLEYSTRE